MTCKICVEHYRDKLNLQPYRARVKNIFSKKYKISPVSDHMKSRVHIKREIQSNREGESDSEENRDKRW